MSRGNTSPGRVNRIQEQVHTDQERAPVAHPPSLPTPRSSACRGVSPLTHQRQTIGRLANDPVQTDPDRPDRPGPQDTETSDAGSWHRDLRPLPPPPPSSPGLPGPHDRRKTKDGRPRSNREQQAAERCRNQRKLQGHGSNQRVDRSPPSQRPPECRPPCPG